MAGPGGSENQQMNRKRAALYVSPFLLLGLADIVLVLMWGINPVMGFTILPPILFISVLAWLAFRSGFAEDRVDDVDDAA